MVLAERVLTEGHDASLGGAAIASWGRPCDRPPAVLRAGNVRIIRKAGGGSSALRLRKYLY